jgi:serine/threonine protein kinase
MLVILDCGERLNYVTRGSSGTIFRIGDSILKIHADYDMGNMENDYIEYLHMHRVQGRVKPGTLSHGAVLELKRSVASVISLTEYAGLNLYFWQETADSDALMYMIERVLDFMLTIYDRFSLVHGDIHEGNILISSGGHVTICDYSCMGLDGTVRPLDIGRSRMPPEDHGETYTLTLSGDLWRAGLMFKEVLQQEKIPPSLKPYVDELASTVPENRVAAARAIVAHMHRMPPAPQPRQTRSKRARDEGVNSSTGQSTRVSPSPEPAKPDSALGSSGPIAATA